MHTATPSGTMALTAGAGEGIPALLLPQREEVVLVMDLVESVRLMASDEQAVIASWRAFVDFARQTVLRARCSRTRSPTSWATPNCARTARPRC